MKRRTAHEIVLLAEVERLAKQVCELKGLPPDRMHYGLPLWVGRVSTGAVEILAKGNPMWDPFRDAISDAFDLGPPGLARDALTDE